MISPTAGLQMREAAGTHWSLEGRSSYDSGRPASAGLARELGKLNKMDGFSHSQPGSHRTWGGKHQFEHWYRDNTAYFITARCRNQFPALASEQAKTIFWERFEKATSAHGFQPWVTSLLDNHYHTIGYLERGGELPRMMQLLHGGVAKLANDLLEQDGIARLVPFWRDSRKKNYFDGCLRDETQGRRTWRYVYGQVVRHGIVRDPLDYAHTRVAVGLDDAIAFALERKAFMQGVKYKRYEHGSGRPA